jgi:hypothetical protein
VPPLRCQLVLRARRTYLLIDLVQLHIPARLFHLGLHPRPAEPQDGSEVCHLEHQPPQVLHRQLPRLLANQLVLHQHGARLAAVQQEHLTERQRHAGAPGCRVAGQQGALVAILLRCGLVVVGALGEGVGDRPARGPRNVSPGAPARATPPAGLATAAGRGAGGAGAGARAGRRDLLLKLGGQHLVDHIRHRVPLPVHARRRAGGVPVPAVLIHAPSVVRPSSEAPRCGVGRPQTRGAALLAPRAAVDPAAERPRRARRAEVPR